MNRIEAARAAAERAGRIVDEAPSLEPYREPGFDELAEVRGRWQDDLPSRLRWASTSDFTPKVADVLDEWAINPRGRNLVLFGPVGVGKSHAAVAACRHGADLGIETEFLPAVEMFELLRPNGPRPGALWELMHVERLILDDIGADRATDWSIDRLYALINRRWLEELPTIVTTNLDPGDLEVNIRADTYSRLVGSGAVTIRLSGDDRRRTPRGTR